MQPTRPIMRWHGGKWEMAAWILDQMPTEHSQYVEPYGGAGSVLLQKRRIPAEIYNDLENAAVTVFRTLQNPATAEMLKARLSLTPYARAEFERTYEPPVDDVDLAAKMIVRSFFGYGSDSVTRTQRTGFRAKCADARAMPSASWPGWVSQIPLFTERLMGVTIESRPAVEVIQRYDGPATLTYCDPPYVMATRSNCMNGKWKGRGYRHDMTDGEHSELATVLHAAQGMVMLSGYSSPLYDELYSDWDSVQCKVLADGARPRVERLWFNPLAWKKRRCQTMFEMGN